MESTDVDPDEVTHLQYKVLLLGDGTCGKTSITRRFTCNEFAQSYLQTLGVDWFTSTLKLPENTEASLSVWDVGGQQIGSKLLPNYIYGSHCILLVYDITNYASFKNLNEWYYLVKKVFKDNEPLIAVVGNKTDLSHLRAVKKSQVQDWAKERDFMNFIVSAKSGDNIRSMFYRISAKLAQIPLPESEIETEVIPAQIVNHPLKDLSEDEENKNVKQTKSKCIIS